MKAVREMSLNKTVAEEGQLTEMLLHGAYFTRSFIGIDCLLISSCGAKIL
jgi:hypothetical protein